MPETLPIQAPGQFLETRWVQDLLASSGRARPILCFSLPHAGSPSLRYPRPHYYHTASYNITGSDIDMHATEDKTGASAPVAIDVCPLPFSLSPIPHPDRIPWPPLPRYALALFVRVHLGEDEAVTLQKESDDSLTPGQDLRRYIAPSKSLDSPDCIFTRARGPLPD